jgi:HD superfamily phosphohydrolase
MAIHNIRDPVHGFITIDDEQARIINTAVFQRLRRIRQLACASLVYPGALHTRFEHSLGVCHVAALMADCLKLGDYEKKLVSLAALLHDVGHGPFSHISEYSLQRFASAEQREKQTNTTEIHEDITCKIIEQNEHLFAILGQERADIIVKLIRTNYGYPINHQIISGPLDADKQDYLLRDSHFCGVRYGVFDIDQLHRTFIKGPDDLLMITENGTNAVEQYVIAKYYMTTQIYMHRVRRITDQMLTRAIGLGIESDNIEELADLYQYDGSDKFVENYSTWDDSRFLNTFGDEKYQGSLCRNLLTRLKNRILLKQVFEWNLSEIEHKELELSLQDLSDEQANRVEAEIADIVCRTMQLNPVDKHYVILHRFDVRSVKPGGTDDLAQIMIHRQIPITLVEASPLFRSMEEGMKNSYVAVYAPVCYTTQADAQECKKRLRDPIRKALQGCVPSSQASEGNYSEK